MGQLCHARFDVFDLDGLRAPDAPPAISRDKSPAVVHICPHSLASANILVAWAGVFFAPCRALISHIALLLFRSHPSIRLLHNVAGFRDLAKTSDIFLSLLAVTVALLRHASLHISDQARAVAGVHLWRAAFSRLRVLTPAIAGQHKSHEGGTCEYLLHSSHVHATSSALEHAVKFHPVTWPTL
jgi:hypothetical protein